MEIVKNVVMPIGLFLFAELVAAVWWASSIDTKVEDSVTKVEQVQQNQLEIREMRIEQKHIISEQARTNKMLDDNEKLLKQLLMEFRQMRLDNNPEESEQ